MKVFVLGKLDSVTQWTEVSVAGFRAAGHEVRAFDVTRDVGALRLHLVVLARFSAGCRGVAQAVGEHEHAQLALQVIGQRHRGRQKE